MNYSEFSHWTNPGENLPALNVLPAEPTALADSLENFVIHHSAARRLGFGVPEFAESDRSSRTTEHLLTIALGRDDRSLDTKRDLKDYIYCTCHDFCLIAAGVLQSRGVDVRLRVGFADYLAKEFWEDHWVCEYFESGEWWLFDPQMGARARNGFAIDFDIGKLNRKKFRSAAQIWLLIQKGEILDKNVGVSFAELIGEWVCAANLLRDVAALGQIEVLPWDFWSLSVDIARERKVGLEARSTLTDIARSVIDFESAAPSEACFPAVLAHWWPGDTVVTIDGGRMVDCDIRGNRSMNRGSEE